MTREEGAQPESADAATGLPGLRSWPMVYGFVVATFVVWVVLLVALSGAFA